MATEKVIKILRSIDQSIRQNLARSPKEMADKFGISERQLYKYLHNMKMLGAPIDYCRKSRRYRYKEDGSFYIGFLEEEKLPER